MDTQKSQLLERLKQATNILVTVSNNPSVDQLSAAIGLTLLLNQLDKHATAVYSGKTPSTIEFLQPEKTLEKNTDSLRDFIIALDKSKADKLRYKVEDQMVKIFITPYRTSISDKDLEFSQGDFNVEVVVALGVSQQQDLDQAITTHGRILHDATVMAVTTQQEEALGSINWANPQASSLCEMLVELNDDLKAEVDAQTATALLTGIVAETHRFSNEKTSSATMQASAKLMAAGANQQLIASELEEKKALPLDDASTSDDNADASTEDENSDGEPEAKTNADGSLDIDHGEKPSESLPEPQEEEELDAEAPQIKIDDNGQLKPLDDELAAEPSAEPPAEPATEPADGSRPPLVLEPPILGGKLTANTEPEGLSPSTDPLSVTTPTGPLLSHSEGPATPASPEPSLPEPDVVNAKPPSPIASEPPTLDPLVPLQPLTADDAADDTVPEPTATPIQLEPITPAPEPAQEPAPEPVETVPVEPPVPPVEAPSTDTLTELEKSVDSPHLEPLNPSAADTSATDTPPADTSGVEGAGTDDINAARDAVSEAVKVSPNPSIEPIQALNASPMDLNLGDIPAVATASASDFDVPQAVTPPPVLPPADTSVASDPGLPPGLVPQDPGLPLDSTAASVINATAPPPVPPPLMPPAEPPAANATGETANGSDSNPATPPVL
ncbi:MAG TPA: hypothetical protein VLF87_01555 [Patescibacteria group bacterium]|nr:hypothetical protein [Patescibacteria group bacterium]